MDLARVSGPGTPHSRTGGEDLERVGAEIYRREGSGLERTAGERVDAETQRLHRTKAPEGANAPVRRGISPVDRNYPGGRDFTPPDRVLAQASRADVPAPNRPHGLGMHRLAPKLQESVPHDSTVLRRDAFVILPRGRQFFAIRIPQIFVDTA